MNLHESDPAYSMRKCCPDCTFDDRARCKRCHGDGVIPDADVREGEPPPNVWVRDYGGCAVLLGLAVVVAALAACGALAR